MRYLSIVLISLALLFTSCESPKSPEETVREYLAATSRFDFKAAQALIIPNKENLKDLKNLKTMGEKMPQSEKEKFLNQENNCTYHEKEITDSIAQIIISPKQEVTIIIEFNLKKVNGNWLIESVIPH